MVVDVTKDGLVKKISWQVREVSKIVASSTLSLGLADDVSMGYAMGLAII